MNYSFYTERMGHKEPKFAWRSKFSGFLYKLDPNKPSKTIAANVNDDKITSVAANAKALEIFNEIKKELVSYDKKELAELILNMAKRSGKFRQDLRWELGLEG